MKFSFNFNALPSNGNVDRGTLARSAQTTEKGSCGQNSCDGAKVKRQLGSDGL